MAGGFKKLDFSFSPDTEVYHSCSLVFNDILYVFGGTKQRRQISRVNGCGLVRVGTLNFDLDLGACTVSQNKILLCFDNSVSKGDQGRVCRKASTPTGLFSTIPESNYHHVRTAIASNGGKVYQLTLMRHKLCPCSLRIPNALHRVNPRRTLKWPFDGQQTRALLSAVILVLT